MNNQTDLHSGAGNTKLSWQARHTILLAMLCLALCMTACGGLSSLASHSNTGGSSDTPHSGSAKPPDASVEHPLQLTSPRTMKYADLQFTVTKGVISNRAPDDADDSDANTATADITLSVVNTLKDMVRIRSGLWQLKLGNGSIYKQTYSDDLEARDTQERKVSFRVPASAKWDGAQLILDEQDKEPATLPLDGPQPQAQYPVKLSATGETTLKEAGMLFGILSASIDLDGFGSRAPAGKRYLIVSVRASNKNAPNGYPVAADTFRLLVDGTPSAPEKIDPCCEVVEQPGSKEFTMAFIVPATASSAELEVGEVGKETARISLDLQAAKS